MNAPCPTCGLSVYDADAYEAAGESFHRISVSYKDRRAELARQIEALDAEYDSALEHLAAHERAPGLGPRVAPERSLRPGVH